MLYFIFINSTCYLSFFCLCSSAISFLISYFNRVFYLIFGGYPLGPGGALMPYTVSQIPLIFYSWKIYLLCYFLSFYSTLFVCLFVVLLVPFMLLFVLYLDINVWYSFSRRHWLCVVRYGLPALSGMFNSSLCILPLLFSAHMYIIAFNI